MILVIAEQKDGTLNRASWEAVAAAQQMGEPITIVVPGASVNGPATELAAADVAGVIALEHAALGAYTPDGLWRHWRRLWRRKPRRMWCCRTLTRRATSRQSWPRV